MNTKKTVKNKMTSLALLMMFSATTIYAADETATSSDRIVVAADNEEIIQDFSNKSTTDTLPGIVLYNEEYTGVVIKGNFTNNGYNFAGGVAYSGVIYNDENGGITSIAGNFSGNYNYSGKSISAGAIYNEGTIGIITGNFTNNFLSSSQSKTNYSAIGGAIYNEGTITTITGDFTGNYSVSNGANTYGGAIYNSSTISTITGNFIGNYTSNKGDGVALGGAIYNTKNGSIGFYASDRDIEFTGNFISNSGTETSNAIHNIGTITFDASSGYSITLNDAISGSTGKITVSGEGSTIFNNTVADQTITVTDSNLVLGSYSGGYTTTYSDYNETTASSSYTASAASADLSASTLNMYNSTLTFAVSNSSDDLANYIVLGSTTLTSTTLALDLTAISGNFSLTIDFSDETCETTLGDSLNALLLSDLSVTTSEGTSIATVNTDESLDAYDYIVSLDGEILAEFDIIYNTTASTITISGTAVPEPSTYAMILGVLALGFAYYRRKSKK